MLNINIAIRGNENNEEVIGILELLGGTNKYNYAGDQPLAFYVIDGNGDIDIVDELELDHDLYRIYEVDEFKRNYPYKIGDKVKWKGHDGPVTITDMEWTEYGVIYHISETRDELYVMDIDGFWNPADGVSAFILKPQDTGSQEIMYTIPKGYEFDRIEGNKIILKPLKSDN